MLLRCLFVLFFLSIPLTVAADWSKVGASGVPVNVEADELTYDKDTGRYRATGNVQLRQGDMELHSRVLWWNQVSGEVEAEGDVQMSSPDEEMSGSKARLNLEQGTGEVENGHIFLKEANMHVRGKQIERRGDLNYRIIDGTFTTCDGAVPAWKFGASQLDVDLGGYARGKNVVFYLADVPSFYVPYMIYPAKSERESGFLTPSIGHSERRGTQFSGAYYLVLGDNQDMTFYLDYLSEMGLGKGLEYRYIFGKDTAGEARVYHIDVKNDKARYALEWQHDGWLPGGVRMVVDSVYVNDKQYFDDFGEVAEEYNKDKVQSILSLSKSWGKYSLVGQMKFTQDLENDNSQTLQHLPQINFDINRTRIGMSPFYYELAAEYNNFWRDEGLSGQRFMLRPSLSANFQLWDVIEVAPEVAYRDRYYWDLSDRSTTEQQEIVEFSTRVSTRLLRVYDQPIGPVAKLRHSIEPEVTYFYTPDIDQSQLPRFVSTDRIAGANRFEYALVQRLTARFDHEGGDSSYRELLYARLSQSYDLREEAEEQPFSAIRGELNLLPTDWSLVRIDTTFDIDKGDWSKFAAEGSMQDQRENSLAVEYRTNRDTELDYGAVKLGVSFLKPFYVSYEQRFDFATSERLEQVYGVEYRHQCWSALLTMRERLLETDEMDRSVLLTFTMKGIGTVGSVGGNLGAL